MSKRNKRKMRHLRESYTKSTRLAIYCIHCKMWFDTKKGWRARRTTPPSCPECNGLLMEMEYSKFIQENINQGRLDEVMTWEYPNGEYWKKTLDSANG